MRSQSLRLLSFLLCFAVLAAFSFGCSERRSEGQKPTSVQENKEAANSGTQNADAPVKYERPVKHMPQTPEEADREKAQRLVNQLYNYLIGICMNTQDCPADFDAAKAAVKSTYQLNWPKDPWGKLYQYKRIDDTHCEVWSAGPDGIDENDDDIRIEEKNRHH